jgi:hypothetical protein
MAVIPEDGLTVPTIAAETMACAAITLDAAIMEVAGITADVVTMADTMAAATGMALDSD